MALLLALAALAALAAWPLTVSVEIGAGSRSLVAVGVLAAAASIPFVAVRGLAEGLQEVDDLNVSTAVALAAVVPLTVWLLSRTGWAAVLFVPSVATGILAPAFAFSRLRNRHPWLRYREAWSIALGRDLLARGAWYMLVATSWTVIYSTDVWMIRLTRGIDGVAPYGITFALFGLFAEPLATLAMTLRTVVPRLVGQPLATNEVWRKTLRLLSVGGFAVLGWGLLWCGVLIDVWAGRDFHPGFKVALFVAFFQAARTVLNASAWMLAPIDGPRPLALALTVDAIVNVGCSFVLGSLVGSWGVAAGSVIGLLSCSGWWITLRASRRFGGIDWREWFPGVLMSASFWVAAAIWQPRLDDLHGPHSLAFAALCGLSTAALPAIVLRCGLDADERARLGRYVGRWLTRRPA